jgi:hypothetical protein
MNLELTNTNIVEVPNATTQFTKGKVGNITTYQFDTTTNGHPMVNAMAGLAVLKDDEQLIMINHCAPMGLFPKIEDEFDFAYSELPNGHTQIVFSRKDGVLSTTDFEATSCSGGCG